MKRKEIIAQLKAMHSNLERWFEDNHPFANWFPWVEAAPIYTQYASITEVLRTEHPSVFANLPVRAIPEPVETSGKIHVISVSGVKQLLREIQYCMDIVTGLEDEEPPTVKITNEGVFFAGQYFDALMQIVDILSEAQQAIVIVDGYIDENILSLLTSKRHDTDVCILTKTVSPKLRTVAEAFNKQYGGLSIKTSQAFHDRFVFIDNQHFYHLGASIKDLGKRGFMFSRIEEPVVIEALRNAWKNEWNLAQTEISP